MSHHRAVFGPKAPHDYKAFPLAVVVFRGTFGSIRPNFDLGSTDSDLSRGVDLTYFIIYFDLLHFTLWTGHLKNVQAWPRNTSRNALLLRCLESRNLKSISKMKSGKALQLQAPCSYTLWIWQNLDGRHFLKFLT